jgi:DNA repair exonuclease SbcCD ATPase subunit
MPATLHSVEQRFIERKTAHAMRQGRKVQLDHQVEEARLKRTAVVSRIELYNKTQELLLKASETARQGAQAKIEGMVTNALDAITGDPYQFKMELNKNAGAWSLSFRVINPAGTSLDPIDGCGGGIADICSMALRIAILEMYEPRVDGPIMLDENFKYLSREHRRTAIEWIRLISEKTGRQILLVTHVPELAAGADRCFEVTPHGETSVIEDVTQVQEHDPLP